jgi:hypothetical protein
MDVEGTDSRERGDEQVRTPPTDEKGKKRKEKELFDSFWAYFLRMS